MIQKNIYYITYATHNERLYNILLESAKKNKINLNIVGFGEKWINWKTRAIKLLENLNNVDDNMLVCHIDAFDSIILGNMNELYNKFIKNYKDKKIVFSNDNSTNIFINYFKLKKFNMCNNNYISGGLFIGYNYYVKYILQQFINSNYYDDQKFFVNICNNDINIGIDTNILFYNYQYNTNKNIQYKNLKYKNNRLIINNEKMPVIISAPGNVNINNLLVLFNYNNNNKHISFISYIIKYNDNLFNLFKIEFILLISLLYCLYKLMV